MNYEPSKICCVNGCGQLLELNETRKSYHNECCNRCQEVRDINAKMIAMQKTKSYKFWRWYYKTKSKIKGVFEP